MDQQNKTTKKKTPGNYFEQLLGGSGRPAKNSVAGGAKSRTFSVDKRLGKGSARGR